MSAPFTPGPRDAETEKAARVFSELQRSALEATSALSEAVDVVETLETALASRDAEIARLMRVSAIVDCWFEPWGAGKAAEWEFLSGDRAFDPNVALSLIRAALAKATGGAA